MTHSGEPVRVIYIAGLGRSGSTLLGQILGSTEGVFYAGELRYLWDWGVMQRHTCGCQKAVPDCEVWRRVLKVVAHSHPELTPELFARLRRSLTKTRHAALLTSAIGRRILGERLAMYTHGLQALYHGIRDVTGSNAIVDSSSSPMYAYALSLISSLDISFVHLVRDPRGHAYSWRRIRDWGDPMTANLMPSFSIVKSTVWWLVWNLITETILARDGLAPVRVRYEDLVLNAPESIVSLARTLGMRLPNGALSDSKPAVAILPENHSVAGNASRYHVGRVELRLDDGWRKEMGSFDKFIVSAISWPLSLKYGYPTWV